MSNINHKEALSSGTRVSDIEFKQVLGSGGFGITYYGWDHSLDRPVAIKEYMPVDMAYRDNTMSVQPRTDRDIHDFDWGMERFLDEARLLAKFDHPNIVRVYRFFKAHGTAYIAMEFVEGETLAKILESNILEASELKSILQPILQGLRVVHEGGFLHRDIKPGNIIIRPSGSPILIDFGSARHAIGIKSKSVTAIVSAGFAPIEQYDTRGKQGPWTDIYALGAVAYKAITGKVPHDATGRIRKDPLIPLLSQNLDDKLEYDDQFLGGIDEALLVDEEERPQSVLDWEKLLFSKSDGSHIDHDRKIETNVEKPKSFDKITNPPASYSLEQYKQTVNIKKWGMIGTSLAATFIAGYFALTFNNQNSTNENHEIFTTAVDTAASTTVPQSTQSQPSTNSSSAALPPCENGTIRLRDGNCGNETTDAVVSNLQPPLLECWDGSKVQSLSTCPKKPEEGDRVLWKAAKKTNTIAGYENYLNTTLANTYRAEALEQIKVLRRLEQEHSAYLKAKQINTVEAYENFLNVWPNGANSSTVKRSAWAIVEDKDSISVYQSYLSSFPDKSFELEARQRLTALLEQQRQLTSVQCSNGSSVADASLCPIQCNDGSFVPAGAACNIQPQAPKTTIALRCWDNSSVTPPQTCPPDIRAETAKWDEAQDKGRSPSFQSYLNQYPNGKWAWEAKQILLGIEKSKDKKYQEAFNIFLPLAEQGVPYAQYKIAEMYVFGDGRKKSYVQANIWYDKLIVSGYSRVHCVLAQLHSSGFGVPKNTEIGFKHAKMCYELGSIDGPNTLGTFYAQGIGVQKSLHKAKELYQEGVELGSASAQTALGLLYDFGNGVPKSDAKAFQLYQQAALQDFANAQAYLGTMYASGEGVKKSYPIAIKWFEKSIEQESSLGYFFLAHMYLKGNGVKRSRARAVRYFNKSAEQGYERAKEELRRLGVN